MAIPKIDTIANINPKKFEPVSPINVFAGEKLYGKNPTNAPDIAVTITVAIIGESFNTNIINNDIHDINDIPDDNPSNPSIKLIAFVTPTIHIIVTIIENVSLNPILYRNGISKCSILVPNATTIIAAIVCPNNSCHGFNVFISSNVPVIAITITPNNTPSSFFPYCCVENKSKLPSIDITAIKYIIDTNTPKITAGPPNFGIAFVCILLLSFGTSTAPILLAIFMVYGVATNDTINANKKAIAIFPHI